MADRPGSAGVGCSGTGAGDSETCPRVAPSRAVRTGGGSRDERLLWDPGCTSTRPNPDRDSPPQTARARRLSWIARGLPAFAHRAAAGRRSHVR